MKQLLFCLLMLSASARAAEPWKWVHVLQEWYDTYSDTTTRYVLFQASQEALTSQAETIKQIYNLTDDDIALLLSRECPPQYAQFKIEWLTKQESYSDSE